MNARQVGRLLSVALIGLLPLQSTPAAAHSELLESSPAAGQTLDELPGAVELTFGEEVQSQGGGIVVVGPDGERVDAASTFAVDGTIASVDLVDGAALPSGRYSVSYRIVSADGHIVSGAYAFRLAGGSGPSATAEPAADPTVGAADGPTSGPATAPVSQDSGSDGTVVWVLGLGAIGLVLVAAVIAVAVRGRRAR